MNRFVSILFAAPLLLFFGQAEAESPQHFALEVKFGPYTPALDQTSGLNGQTPFSNLFGNPGDPLGAPPSSGLLSLVEFDYQFFQRFGSLAVGLVGGYYSKSASGFQNVGTAANPQFCSVQSNGMGGRAYVANGVVQNPPDPCFSGDQNIFNMVPLQLMLIYRFDVLDRRLRIPIVPYFKAGFAYYIWWFGNSGSFVSQVTSKDSGGNVVTQNASGATAGFVLNPGLAVDLSTLDPAAARAIDMEIGLNRVLAFIELHAAFIGDCCVTSMKLNLSDVTFTGGLAFEF